MKKIGFCIGVGINILYLYINSDAVISYLRSPTVSEAYSYRYVLIYLLFFLFLISSLVIAIYFRAQWPNPIYKKLALTLFLFNVGSSFGIDYFLQSDVNKIKVILHNMSVEPLGNIWIVARNNQKLEVGYLPAGQQKEVFCDCREVDIHSSDSIGLRLRYQFNDSEKEAKYDLFYANEPEYDDYVEVRVIDDTLVYRSHNYGNQILWEAVGFTNGLHPWDTIRKTLPNTKHGRPPAH